MPDFKRSGTGIWRGTLQEGSGAASSQSGALQDVAYSFPTRFENAPGSNPEEMIAAAHAACFSMALSAGLGRAGTPPEEIRTKATVTLNKSEAGFKITAIHLETEGRVPGIDAAAFQQAAEGAKENCPVSKLLKPGLESLTLDAKLVS
jgi:osmotically inducible protein OsmC